MTPHIRHRPANQRSDVAGVISNTRDNLAQPWPRQACFPPDSLFCMRRPRSENVDIQRYLLDYDRNKKDASATAQLSATRKFSPRRTDLGDEGADLGTGLQSHELKLLTLIEELAEYINSEDGPIRSKSKSCTRLPCFGGCTDVVKLWRTSRRCYPSSRRKSCPFNKVRPVHEQARGWCKRDH